MTVSTGPHVFLHQLGGAARGVGWTVGLALSKGESLQCIARSAQLLTKVFVYAVWACNMSSLCCHSSRSAHGSLRKQLAKLRLFVGARHLRTQAPRMVSKGVRPAGRQASAPVSHDMIVPRPPFHTGDC